MWLFIQFKRLNNSTSKVKYGLSMQFRHVSKQQIKLDEYLKDVLTCVCVQIITPDNL